MRNITLTILILYIDTSNFGRIDNLLREGGSMSVNANKVPGMNSMATYIHDPWSNTVITKVSPILQLTITPAIFIQYCATFPGACGVMITNTYNNN